MEDKILADFAKAWQTLDAELIIKYLDDSFVYDSQWFFESLDCEAYKKYLRTKFLTMKEKMQDHWLRLLMILRVEKCWISIKKAIQPVIE